MTFLQPLLLAALPLAALPIIIHLINQWRYQNVRWGAMMFLLAAQRMSRGYTKIRQWLILLFRMLAIAGLIFAISRPLAGGLLGWALGGRPDTTIIVLDRSPSMQQRGTGVVSKLEAGIRQLTDTLDRLGSNRWVLIENTAKQPLEIASPKELLDLPETQPVDSSADLPAMLESALAYVKENKTGQTDIWICSDLKQHDWQPESGRWHTLREQILALPQGVRIRLLAYPEASASDTAIRVTEVRRVEASDGASLLVSLKLSRNVSPEVRTSVPIRFDLEGARSEVTVEMSGSTFELKDHRIPLASGNETGWGKASIPADENPADNDSYFVFDKQRQRQSLIVSEDPDRQRALQIAASIPPNAEVTCVVDLTNPSQFAAADLSSVGLIVWHATLPSERDAKILQRYVERGGRLLFLPPAQPGDEAFLGVRWLDWVSKPEEITVETWRSDQDLLANAQSGASLPVGAVQVRRYCRLEGELTSLANIQGGDLLFGRLPTARGGVYFCTTTTSPSDSALASNGIVLYVAVHRALAEGAEGLGETRRLVAGQEAAAGATWRQFDGVPDALSTQYAHYAGVYAADDKLLSVNRDPAEDDNTVVADGRLAELFSGVDFTRVDDTTGGLTGLIQEIWRVFLLAMMIALIVEAILSLPRTRQGTAKPTFPHDARTAA